MAFVIRIVRVSAFLPEVTQQIHSFFASGVISSHTANAAGAEAMAFLKSIGILCTVPFLVITQFYQILTKTKLGLVVHT